MPLQPWSALLDQAEDGGGWEVLPAADYDLKVEKAEAAQASSGNLMYKTVYSVVNGPYQGKRVWDQIVLAPNNPTALSIFFRKMAAFGIDKSYFASNPSDHQVAEALTGRMFRGQVGVRQYQGQDKNEVKRYSPLTDASPTPPPAPQPQIQPPAQTPPPQTAAPAMPTAPATPTQSAAVTPPAATPPRIDETPEPPSQPAVPPVPETPAAAPVAQQPPAAATPPAPPVEQPPAAPPVPQPTPAAPQDDSLPPPPPF